MISGSKVRPVNTQFQKTGCFCNEYKGVEVVKQRLLIESSIPFRTSATVMCTFKIILCLPCRENTKTKPVNRVDKPSILGEEDHGK